MKFTSTREALLRPLQLVTGVVERRQTLPVLSNLQVTAEAEGVSLTGTDLEVALNAKVAADVDTSQPGSTTVPARKLADIWRSLPEGASVTVQTEADRSVVRSGKSKFTLATLPVTDFPKIEQNQGDTEIRIERAHAQRLLDQTAFSMAQQDVRYGLIHERCGWGDVCYAERVCRLIKGSQKNHGGTDDAADRAGGLRGLMRCATCSSTLARRACLRGAEGTDG